MRWARPPAQLFCKASKNSFPILRNLLAGLVVFAWGCCMYAEGKGYHPVVGVVGLFSLIGLLILAALHDKHPESDAAARSPAEPRATTPVRP
jgi:hypothetical protein